MQGFNRLQVGVHLPLVVTSSAAVDPSVANFGLEGRRILFIEVAVDEQRPFRPRGIETAIDERRIIESVHGHDLRLKADRLHGPDQMIGESLQPTRVGADTEVQTKKLLPLSTPR